jgi:hypothetical protein
MALPAGSIYEIRWNELCPWLVLTKAWRVSLLVRVLAYAWAGLLLTQWGWQACQYLWSDDNQSERISVTTIYPSDIMDIRELRASERRLAASSLFSNDGSPRRQRIRAALSEPHPLAWLRIHIAEHSFGPLIEGWRSLSLPFVKIFQFDASLSDVLRLLACGLWAIAVWAIFGSAIARTAARYCTREEIITPLAAGRAAMVKWPSTAGSPLIVLLLGGALVLPLALVGLLMRADLLAMFAGFLWLLSLAWGFGIAVVLIAVWFGWPLMWATIAVERSDAFDAASRTAAYVYQRPLRLIFYVVVASLLGMVGHLIVAGFTAAASYLADWSMSWGSGLERMSELTRNSSDGVEPTFSGSATLAIDAIGFWKSMLTTLAAAYPLAYLFSASVGIYLLVRMDIDSTEMDEITADAGEDPLPHELHLDEATGATD